MINHIMLHSGLPVVVLLFVLGLAIFAGVGSRD